MDRKSLLTFIAIYSIAAGAAFFFGAKNEVDVTSMVDQQAPYTLQGESIEAVAAAVRSVDGEITRETTGVNHWVDQE